MAQINTMGNEVAEGYKCKPATPNPNKPIMYFKSQIIICDGGRCHELNSNLANELRDILEEINLNSGKNRIKVIRSYCFGACRFKQVAQVVENSQNSTNNCVIIKNVNKFDRDKWKRVFLSLSSGEPLSELDIEFVPMQEIE